MDTWLLLDPGSLLVNTETGGQDFHRWTTQKLAAWWIGWDLELGIKIPIYGKGTMITLTYEGLV